MDASDLVAAPRGRRLCLDVATRRPETWTAWCEAGSAADPGILAAALARTPLPGPDEPLLDALADTVTRAAYWQPLDPDERLLDDPVLREPLSRIASAVLRSPSREWWHSPVDRATQSHVQWIGLSSSSTAARLDGAAERLDSWHAQLRDAESRDYPADLDAPISGHWWSTPAWDVTTTSRRRPGLAATQLRLVEDGGGWSEALVTPLRPDPAARVLEITGPADLAALVDRHPLDVSRSRRHDWYRATGASGRWLVPDWRAVAEHHDGVHLTIGGYLSTAGRVVPVAGGTTTVAGWDPDATIWLTDVLSPAGPATTWRYDQPEDRWVAA